MLIAPLAGTARAKPTPQQIEQEGAEFMAFYAQVTGQAG